ncbi:unnamed protein product [Adineta steineri]|uniref:Major facilitator superfamily associated domain-containing protein n=1 Tax=Adineta steineri TaxID=433720 RepID=A0A815DCI7_9BILA|nr:unnamed protein product [Adineta steineri]CAF3774003.1 unnamed protein product [Adineta steineri]
MESPSMLAPTTDVVGPSPSVSFFQRHYFLLKAHYFLFFSAFGVLYPILNITLRGRGLSNTEISYINLIIPFLVFFTNPLVGFLADHSRRYLLTFNIILGITTILYGLMFILPSVKTHHIQANMINDYKLGRVLDFCASKEVATLCSARSDCGCSYQSYCKADNFLYNFTFTMKSTDIRQNILNTEPATCGIEYRIPIDEYIRNYTSELSIFNGSSSSFAACEVTCTTAHFCHGERYSQQIQYILLYSILFIIGTNLLSNTITIGASIGFATLPRADKFGEQRVFGTIGFGISALTASRLYKIFNTDIVYIIMFAILTALCICITCFIRIPPQKDKENTTSDDIKTNEEVLLDFSVEENKKKPVSQFKLAALIPLLKKIDVIIFFSLTFIWGMSYGGLDPYVFLYIDEIAPCASHLIVGWMSLISAASEVIALFVAGKMLKLLGTNASSVIILIAFSIRFGGYYYIRRPYFLLFMETMHYFNFGILYVLIAQKADAIAPPGLAGTLQGVVYGVSFGLGRGVGLIISSFIYTRLQSRPLFLFFSLFNAAAAIVYGILFIVTREPPQNTNRTNNNPNVPKIVIDPDTNVNEELLNSSSTDKVENKFNEQ